MSDEPLYFCRVPDHLGAGGDCRWPDPDVPFALVKLIPGVSEGDYLGAALWSAAEIAKVCRANLHEITTAAAARILLSSRTIDGPGGVLAEANLPCGNLRQCGLWCDGSDRWDVAWQTWGDPIQSGRIPLRLVVLHEGLHAVGLPHTNQPGNVMNPSLQTSLRGLGLWDRAELIRRYGAVPVSPPPPPPPVPPGDGGGGIPPGGLVQVINALRAILPFLKLIARATPTTVDDAVVAALESFLNSIPAATDRAGVVAALRLAADQVETTTPAPPQPLTQEPC